VVLLNRSDSAQTVTVKFADAGLGGAVSVRDLEARKQLGSFTGSYTATVPADGTAMLLLSGTDALPGVDLGGTATGDPALVRVNDADSTVFVRGANGRLEEQSTTNSGAWSGTWTQLGGPGGGGILGQPAAYAGPDGSIALFVRGDDSQAYQRTYADGAWGPWIALGGHLADAPTVAYSGPGSWLLTATGTDGRIWTRGANSGWSSIGTPAGLSVYGRPSAVTEGSTTYVAVRTNDDAVWLDTATAGGSWSGWTGLGGTVSDSPTLLATSSGLRLFARASDYTVWENDLAGGTWAGWTKENSFTSDDLNGSVGAVVDGGGASIAYRGIDGHLHLTEL
jgi:alpha-galactosidase